MDAAMKKTGVTCIIIGIVVTAIAPTTGGLVANATIRQMGAFCAALGTIIFLYGCVQIAKAKGQPWFYGLLGLLSCLGLAVLWFIVPDNNKKA